MTLPSVSSPFNYLVEQITLDIERAADICSEIKKNRHVGYLHKALDSLEASLRAGLKFIRS